MATTLDRPHDDGMGDPARLHRYTFTDYLALEEVSNVKHEFLDGEIYAMAGGTIDHAALSGVMITTLSNALRGRPCRVFSSDLRVRVPETGLATYPDVTVVCGRPETDPQSRETVTNPTVVVEVLSDSTIDYDRGKKLHHFQRIPSLQAVVLVWQREPRIELHQRTADGAWHTDDVRAGHSATIAAVGVRLDVDAIFDAATDRGEQPA